MSRPGSVDGDFDAGEIARVRSDDEICGLRRTSVFGHRGNQQKIVEVLRSPPHCADGRIWSCSAKRNGKDCSPKLFMTTARATSRLSRSTGGAFRGLLESSCSAMRARLRAQHQPGRLELAIRERCSSTKSASCRQPAGKLLAYSERKRSKTRRRTHAQNRSDHRCDNRCLSEMIAADVRETYYRLKVFE